VPSSLLSLLPIFAASGVSSMRFWRVWWAVNWVGSLGCFGHFALFLSLPPLKQKGSVEGLVQFSIKALKGKW